METIISKMTLDIFNKSHAFCYSLINTRGRLFTAVVGPGFGLKFDLLFTFLYFYISFGNFRNKDDY